MPMPIRLVLTLVVALALPLAAQEPDPARLTVHRIYGTPEFRSESFGPTEWLGEGDAYTTVESAPGGSGQQIVRYDAAAGRREVLITAEQLTPAGDTAALEIEGYSWSPDGSKLLVFTNSERVWRQNTRGDYWVLDRESGKLTKLGGSDAKPSTLMFAKFSPDGGRVGYVRENNLYVEDLASGSITPLTDDGSRTIINGTFDWVYEEELGLRDGWRWSPDGEQVAYWQLNADRVLDFTLVNYTDSLYPILMPVQYPKAGEENSAARIGVVSAAGGETRWFNIEGDPRNHYLARMDWAANSDQVVIQQLNRLQNTNRVLLGNAATGEVREILVERDSGWVEVVDDLVWLDDGERFLWLSERDGWNHAYVVSRDGGEVRLITPGEFDLLEVAGVDAEGGWLYYIASPENPTQRYLFRTRLDGRGRAERLTPAEVTGVNDYNISPNFRWALHAYSSFEVPPTIELVELPDHRMVRELMANERLKAKVAALDRGPVEFFQVDIGDGIRLNAYMMKPVDFDSTKSYPILFHVYGGPGSQTVVDSWGGSQYLWHLMLTQNGVIVASVDNRGTGARGRDWRRIIYEQLGVVETRDQAAAAQAIWHTRPYVDSTRTGIWGWSYGGFMSLNTILQFPEVYSTAMAVAPVTHWTLYDNIYTERYNGLPAENPEGYDRGSPLSYADQLQGDLLIVHGSGDDNVHFQNTLRMVNALVAAGKPFELMVYPNRTHSISGGNTREHLFTTLTRFVNEHLVGAGAGDREMVEAGR